MTLTVIALRKPTAQRELFTGTCSPGIVAESDLSGVLKSEYVFFDGERIARRDLPAGSVAYYFSDHLKTASVITDSLGNIKSESDYYPWGGELQFVNNDSNHYKFTGKERDETGLDYFGARYYSNGLARFITPDWAMKAEPVPYATLIDPQSLNLYAYVKNNPAVLTDEDGHECKQHGQRFDCNYHFPDQQRGYAIPFALSGTRIGWGTGAMTGVAAGLVVGAASVLITRSADAIVDNNNDKIEQIMLESLIASENASFMGENKDTLKKIQGLVTSAAGELGKVTGNDPNDPHHKQEGRAMLDRAKKLANRLPAKMRDAVLQGIRSLEGRVPGGLK